MPIRVTMRESCRSEDGLSILLQGQTYTLSDDFARQLILSRGNFDTDNVLLTRSVADRDQLLTVETRATRTLLAGTDNVADLVGPGLLSGVSYDASNRAIQWTLDGVTYTASYSPAGITVAGSDGTITNIGVDPAQRITSVATA